MPSFYKKALGCCMQFSFSNMESSSAAAVDFIIPIQLCHLLSLTLCFPHFRPMWAAHYCARVTHVESEEWTQELRLQVPALSQLRGARGAISPSRFPVKSFQAQWKEYFITVGSSRIKWFWLLVQQNNRNSRTSVIGATVCVPWALDSAVDCRKSQSKFKKCLLVQD